MWCDVIMIIIAAAESRENYSMPSKRNSCHGQFCSVIFMASRLSHSHVVFRALLGGQDEVSSPFHQPG